MNRGYGALVLLYSRRFVANDSKKGWHVVSAQFEQSATVVGQCPDDGLPEIAIAGRSNVGKSSLLNALSAHRGLARVSRTPGRTQLLNLFKLVLRGPGRVSIPLRFCDLPGYGYAAAGRAVRQTFAPMIEGYLTQRPTLRGLVMLVDVRRGVGELDLGMMRFLSERGLPTLLVATKADKLGASQRGLARRRLADSIGAQPRDVLLTSASSGLGISGPDGLAADLADLVRDDDAEPPTPDDEPLEVDVEPRASGAEPPGASSSREDVGPGGASAAETGAAVSSVEASKEG